MVGTDALGSDFCLTFVRGVDPGEVISRLGGRRPVPIVSVKAAVGASEAVRERVDADGRSRPSRLGYVAVTPVEDWTLVIEPSGFLCTGDEAVRVLSGGGELVSFYYNENAASRFSWVIDGREVAGFDPASPRARHGSDPGRLETQFGFVMDDDDRFPERTFALLERITGVRWDAGATFQCAAVAGVGARHEPWHDEIRDELAAYAEDPGEWTDGDFDRWAQRGVTDRRVRALGAAGMTLYQNDRDLALAIAFAPAELIERMTVWIWERPFRLAGILDEPWFAPIRDRVRRGADVAPADVRRVEERMDAFLRTAAPWTIRDREDQRRNAVRSILVPWGLKPPVDELCWMFARAEAAGAGPGRHAELRRAFPELGDVVIPPPPEPRAERAAARRKREAGEKRAEEGRLANLSRRWGGRIPTDPRLLEPTMESNTVGLVPYDRDLIDRIAEAFPPVQRRMAVWVARYCCTRSGLIATDWAEAGVIALERGDPPPPWFADFRAAFARWRDVPRESVTSSSSVSFGDREPPRIDPAVLTLHVIIAARHPDPLFAAMDTVRNAVLLDDGGPVLTEFRAAFSLT